MINKVSEIDLKIKDLQDKKKKLEEKQFLQLAQMIKKSGASVLSSEILVGVMLEAVKTFEENHDAVKKWQQVGKEFLTAEKEKNGKKKSQNKENDIKENEEEEVGKDKKSSDSFRK
jgi:hypothetical protein